MRTLNLVNFKARKINCECSQIKLRKTNKRRKLGTMMYSVVRRDRLVIQTWYI